MLTIVNCAETHAGAAGPPAGMARKARVSAADAGTGSAQAPGPIRIVLPWLCIPQTWRSASGLVLFAFVLTHFLNHALGHVSLETMQQAQMVHRAIWESWPGTLLLYGAVAVHIGLALWKLANRHTWRMPLWEAAQIALGLSIPFLAAGHVMTTRGLSAFYGVEPTYATHLRLLWPAKALTQSLLLVIVWLHAMIGLHHWLRLKSWYRAWSPLLLALAVLVPVLALTGWIEGARRLALMHIETPPLSGYLLDARAHLIDRAEAVIWSVALIVSGMIVTTRLAGRLGSGPTIVYPGRQVKGEAGATLLEISRAAGIPHASVCGGRGRCTTCRVLVLEGSEHLPPPNATEAAALLRIKAPPGIRLACQIRPSHPLTVRPLIPLRASRSVAGQDDDRWGVERRVTIMFADLRGFTRLAESLYPYDTVFLLNRYFEAMEQEIRLHGGRVDKFLGDGIMAVFDELSEGRSGSCEALEAAQAMLTALEELNAEFRSTLSQPLRIGIGIHTGPAILGRIGAGQERGVTALGDSVNVASRLEALNKEFGSVLIASDATVRSSGLDIPGAELREIAVRGRVQPLRIHVLKSLRLSLMKSELSPALRACAGNIPGVRRV
jgi:adenylate cyclase